MMQNILGVKRKATDEEEKYVRRVNYFVVFVFARRRKLVIESHRDRYRQYREAMK